MRVRWAGAMSLLGGVYFMFAGIVFAVTHGSTTYNRNDPWLGLSAVELSQFMFLSPLFFFIALLGYEESFGKVGRMGRVGLRAAQGSCLLQAVSYVLQTNVVDPLTEWRSPVVIGGWMLFLLTVLSFAVGMFLWGAALAVRRALPRAEALLFSGIGVCSLGALLLEFWISETSDGSLMWEIAIGAKNVPLALCWMGLGVALLSRTGRKSDGFGGVKA
ncbi:hypothetical protein FE782_17070 [Paenibacillus antri]|uniref:Uncharacterized protein n=1 Tax=Paenibacillus antri TaxID=2582848 RepID=A0A5R9G7P5_9BACL|nr:hypothetical protein [Paenibacillus antri]TLS51099.1 hypothetical protein FE782_17070 [Paenibacillus antri]